MGRIVVAAYRWTFATLAIAAMAWQAWKLHQDFVLRPANFLSFFTIQSNIIASAVFLYGGWLVIARRPASRHVELIRGASVVNMAVTGVVFAVLLAGLQEDLQTHIAWVNNVLHKVMPLAVVLDWVIDPPRHRIELQRAWRWLLFPLSWVVYTLLRGPIADWYPYPFVDPRLHGYDRAAVMCSIIFLGFVATVVVTATVGNLRGGFLRVRLR